MRPDVVSRGDSELPWPRVKELFEATYEAGREERQRILDAAVAPGDPLRRRVEELLAAHDKSNGALDRPPLDILDGLASGFQNPAPRLAGRNLGPWRVVREIARGGMGAIYEGVRDDAEFEQRVAIKTIRVGAYGDSLVRRFQQERRILAALQHPNIAALYDGGITEDGLPWFVLEYVDGNPIDAWCDERRLALGARLDLFRQVVAAVQYAHRQLVVHRDLKPSNILVTRDGVVKLVDFGIAKLMLPETAETTAEWMTPLTMSYASPEQLRGSPITTASDVYSLGVVLYRLLAGTNPLSVHELPLDRAIATITEQNPPPPSVAATHDAAVSAGLGDRERLRRALAGDLDWIVMKALRKEPERRYATVQELGDDLQRYLRGLPVHAAPDTLGYRFRKFVRRRRAVVAASALGGAALIAGSTVAVWQARIAGVEAARSRATAAFLQSVIGAGDLSGSSRGARLGPGATVGELLDSAAQRLPVELRDDPGVRGTLHFALGRAFSTQERYAEAITQFDSARAAITRRYGPRNVDVAYALLGAAEAHLLQGGARPDSFARKALDILESSGRRGTFEHAQALRALGVTLALQAQWKSSLLMLDSALTILRRIRTGPTVLEAITLAARQAVAETSSSSDSIRAQSRTAYRQALAMFDSIPGSEVVEKGEVFWYAARLEAATGNLAIADSLSREGLALYERAAGPFSHLVAGQLAQLAELSRIRGNSETARRHVARALDIIRRRTEVIPLTRERVLIEYARQLFLAGRLDSAAVVGRVVYEGRLGSGNDISIIEAAQLYGDALHYVGRYAEAEKVLRDALPRSVAAFGTTAWSTQLTAMLLARMYYALGRQSEATRYLAILPDSTAARFRAAMAAGAARSGGRED